MAATAMKHMTSNFVKLDKFKEMDFRRWQKKMCFLISSMSVVYVPTTPIPEDGENATVDQIRRRNKWNNDEYVCRGLILKVRSSLFTQHKMNMDEAIQVSCIIDKLPPSWKDFKHTLKHNKEELTLVELGSHLRIEESLRAQDSDKPKGNNVVGPAVVRLPDPKIKTFGERGIECIFVGYAEHSKAFRFYVIEPNESVSINSIIESKDAIFDENRFSLVYRPSLRIPNKTKDIGGIRDEVSDQHSYCFNATDDPKTFDKAMKSHDVAFWKEEINDRMDSIMGSNTWVLADLPPGCKPLGCKWIFKIKLKVDGTIEKFKAILVIQDFRQKSGIDYFDTYAPVVRISTIRLLIAMESIHNLIIHQMDVKIALLNGELDEEVYMNQPQCFIMPGNENKFDESGKGVIICLYIDDMLIFGTDEVQANLTKEFFSSKFSMKDMEDADVISVSTPMDTSEKKKPNNSQVVSQIEYSRVIGCLKYAMTCTKPDIAFAVVLDGYTNASWINNTKENSSTSGWVFLLGGGAISWDFKKQTCITGLTMKSEFVALAAAGKEVEWLKNLLLEIPLWSKPIAPISIRCDSAATLTKAYSQMYNGKSRRLGVKHSMIRKLIKK
ncbi:zinc finger, CCHC-type containing protein [Tanacetum coccineum]